MMNKESFQYCYGAFVENGVLVRLPEAVERTDENAFSDKWDVFFRINVETVEIQFCEDVRVLFRVEDGEQELFVQSFLMFLEHPNRYIGMDLVDVVNFCRGCQKGFFLKVIWSEDENTERIKEWVKHRAIVLLNGISMAETTDIACCLENQQVLLQFACEKAERAVYVWSLDPA